jgi:hypothetical protein
MHKKIRYEARFTYEDEVWFMHFNKPRMMRIGLIKTLHSDAPANKKGYTKEESYSSKPYDENIGWIKSSSLFKSREKLIKSL